MLFKSLLIVSLLSGSFLSLCADMIIPIVINKKAQNVVTVAKSKGDFTDINAAIASITDASATKRYVIFIAPGIYTPSAHIVMKEYVSITGSGEGSTLISGFIGSSDFDADSALIVGANHTSLTNLTIKNYGFNTRSYSIALILDQVSMRIENITVEATGVSSNNYGVYLYSSSDSIIKNITAGATGSGAYNSGITVIGAGSVVLSNIVAYARNGTNSNHAVENSAARVFIRRSTLDAEDAGSYGIKNFPNNASVTRVSQTSVLRRVTGDHIICILCDDSAGALGSGCNSDVNGI